MQKKEMTPFMGNIMFYLSFIILFGMRMWGIYESKVLYVPLLVVGMVLWFVSFVLSEHSLLEYFCSFAFMCLAAVIYYNSGEKGLVLYFALMLGMKNTRPEKLFQCGSIIGGMGIATLSFLSAFGVIEDVAYIQFRRGLGNVFRRSLGFAHPNTLSSSFFIVAVMTLYLIGWKDKKRLWKVSLLILYISIYLYTYSGSRTGLVITMFYLALNLFCAYKNKIGFFEKILVALLLPFIWLLSIVGPALATEDDIAFVRSIDQNLGSRWAVGNYYIGCNKLSLFGQRLNNPDNNVYGIDMSQLYLLIQLGVVAFVILTLIWCFLMYYEIKLDMRSELLITVTMLVMGITDPFLYNLGFKNIAFVFAGKMLYSFIDYISKKLPGWLTAPIVIRKLEIKEIRLPRKIERVKIGGRQQMKERVISSCGMVLFLAMAIVLYAKTPEPHYVLADRNSQEQSIYVFGRTRRKNLFKK